MDPLPVLDPRPLQDLAGLGTDSALIQELIDLLASDTPPRLEALAVAVTAGQAHRVVEEAHQIKGSVGNLGLMRMSHLAGQIEARGRLGRLEGLLPMVEALEGAYQEGLAALKKAFPV